MIKLGRIKLNRLTKSILIHAGVWFIFALAIMLETKDLEFTVNVNKINFPIWTANFITFYVSYLLLTPLFLFKKRYVLFVLLSVLFISSASVGATYLHNKKRMYEAKENIMRRAAQNQANQPALAAVADTTATDSIKSTTKKESPTAKASVAPAPVGPNNANVIDDKVLYDRFLSPKALSPLDFRNSGMLYGLLFIFSCSIIIRFFEKTTMEEKKTMLLEKEKISSELKYLKQQINPHFLFNALNSIYSLAILNSDNTPDAVLKLSSILRYMLYETDKDKVQFLDELEVIENYLGLQQLRLTEKTKIVFNKVGHFDPYRIEPMLLIPILENAFKYGVDSSKATDIYISLTEKDKHLDFVCSNEIVTQNNDSKNSGIGIKNIERRLDLIYGNSYSLVSQTIDNNFIVKLNLPLKYN
ncbi:MAG: histidine kinase [Rikenellaceae bacterium]